MRAVNSKSFMIVSNAGCLLPALIILNLFFGWVFLGPALWLLTGAVLVGLFILNSFIMVKKTATMSRPRKSSVIDIEAEVLDDKKQVGGKKEHRT